MRTVFLAIAVIALLPRPAGAIDIFNLKNSLIQFALEQISTEDFTITAENVESPGDGETALVGVQIADRQGVWFEAGRLGLKWNARRILAGELEINRLFAADVRVLRRPEGSVEVAEDGAIAQADPAPFSWPRAPIATRIDEMRLERVFVAEGVIGAQSLSFDADGAARDEGTIQAVRLSLTRSDAVTGRISLDYERAFDQNTLRANLDAAEAAGGLVAELAGLPEDSASRITVAADGPLTRWSMVLEAAADRVFDARGEAAVDLEGPLAVAGAFRLVPGPALDPTVAALIGEAARLDLDIAEDQTGVIAIRSAEIASPALTLDAAGSYDKATGRADLDLGLDARGELADLIDGVRFDGLGFDGQLRGTPSDLTASGLLQLTGLATAPVDVGAAALTIDLGRQGEQITLRLAGNGQRLRLDQIGPELLGTADLRADVSYLPDQITISAVSLSARPLELSASGAVDLAGATAALAYEISAPRLGPLARAYGVAAEGAASAEGQVRGPFAAIRAEGNATLRDLVFDGEAYGVVALTHDVTAGETVQGAARVSASGSRLGPVSADLDFALANQTLTLPRLEAEGLGARVAGSAVYALRTGLAEGEVVLDAPELAPLAALAEAPVTGTAAGRVGFAPEAGQQGATLDLQIDGFEGFGAAIGRARLELAVADALGQPSIEGRMALAELSGFGAALASAEAKVSAAGLTEPRPTGTARLRGAGLSGAGVAADRLDLDARLTEQDASAQADIDIAVGGLSAGGARVPSLTLAAQGRDVLGASPAFSARAEAPRVLAPGAEISTLRLTAAVSDALANPRLEVALQTGQITAGAAAALDALSASLRGPLDALAARLATDGTAAGEPVSLSATAEIDAAAETPRIRVDTLQAAYAEERASLERPLTVTAGDTLSLDGLALALPEGRLTGDAALHPDGLAADLALSLADLSIAKRLADAPVAAGALEAKARLDTRPGRAGGMLDLAIGGLRFDAALAPVGQLEVQAVSRWDGRRADLEARLEGPFGRPLRAEGAVPLRATGGALPRIPPREPLSARLIWAGDVGDLWVLVPAPGHVLDGNLDLDLGVAGSLDEPRIAGRVALSEGRYENLDLGTILTDLTLGSEIAGPALALDLAAADGAGGQVTAQAELEPNRLSAQISADGAVLVRRDDATAAVSLDIRADGPLAGPDISGTVNVDRAEIRLVNATPPSVVTLDGVRIKGAPAEEEAPAVGGEIGLDLKIRGDRDIFVRGRGLDSEWAIDLAVGGSAAAPRITGSIDRVRGRLSLVGTLFDLKTGQVVFLGGPEIDPNLDVELEADENGVTGGIRVSGKASDPQIAFYSRQGLPEDEVLPRLLFGKPSGTLTASQGLRLAAGLGTLLDGSGGLVDDVRGAVGLDTLYIDPTEDSAEVTVGKNIADNVFVGAKQSLDGKESRVVVEVEIFEDVHIDSEIDQEGDPGIGIQWRKDF